jgi:hypothetical protein
MSAASAEEAKTSMTAKSRAHRKLVIEKEAMPKFELSLFEDVKAEVVEVESVKSKGSRSR